MATVSNTYDISNAIKEDVADVISNISPYDTPVMTALGSGRAAMQPNFEWLTDDLAAADNTPDVEGAEAKNAAITDVARLSNYTQINSRTVKVTGTADATDNYGKSKEFAYQMAKKGKELKKDMEKAIAGVHAVKNAGTSSVARVTGSLGSFINSNAVFGNATPAWTGSGADAGTQIPNPAADAALTEAMFQEAIENAWNEGGEPSKAFMRSDLKKSISQHFAGRADEVRTMSETTSANVVVDFYVSDFGTIEMFPCRADRFVEKTIFVLDPAKASVRYLRNFQNIPLAKTGDNDSSLLLAEYGLEVTNPKAHSAIYGVTPATA